MKTILLIILCGVASAALAQEIRGHVVEEGSPQGLPLVSVYLPDLRKGVATDSAGNFTITGLPSGNFIIELSRVGYGTIVQRVNTTETSVLQFVMSPSVTEMQELVVTGSPSYTERARNPVPIVPVRREILLQHAPTNLIDGLTQVPGINQVSTGPAISKPVIRGLGYNRVVVLRNGIRQEGQQWGDEHGIEIDEYEVDQVEVVKGPGSLMYGSDAMAGVVNFITPRPVEEGTSRGEWISGFQSNGNLLGNSVMYTSTQNGFNWLARVSAKKAGNFSNPVDGHVLNSGFEEIDASGNMGLHRKWGFSQLRASIFNQKPGLIDGARDASGNFTKQIVQADTIAEVGVPESERKGYNHSIILPYQKIQHARISLTNNVFFGESNLQITLSWQQNRRREFDNVLDPAATDLSFLLTTYNADAKYFFPEKNGWQVSSGAAFQWQGNENFGESYLIPAYHMADAGGFLYAKKDMGPWSFSGGIRADHRYLSSEGLYLDTNGKPSASGTQKFSAFERTFINITGSAGITYSINERAALRFNVSRGFRAPNLSELGSNGKHEGTYRYEVGNPDLNPETSLQVDAGMSYNGKHISLEVDGFYNHIQQYIYLEKVKTKSGADSIVNPLDPAPMYRYVQGNAALYGAELSFDIHPHPLDQLHLENSFSFVRGIQSGQPDSMKNVPMMPAPKFQTEVRWQFKKQAGPFSQLYIKADAYYFFRQPYAYTAYGTETPTPDYWLVGAGAGAKWINGKKKEILSIYLSCTNLFNVAYMSHLSRLKYAPVNPATGTAGIYNAGRNFSIKITVPIGG